MSSAVAHTPAPGRARFALAIIALVLLGAAGAHLTYRWVCSPELSRPHDFLQVWSAGRLFLAGENPYDGRVMWELQSQNRTAYPIASMMWVPPWGMVVAAPLGALPIGAAQLVWVYGQYALILASSVALWFAYGGTRNRMWIPVLLAATSGPVWWQVALGQYAGLLLAGLAGYVCAHRANRPILGGAFLFLIALKPHLFAYFAVGLLIDATRTAHGRRVVLGGAVVLVAACAAVSVVNPHVWHMYRAAAGGGSTAYYPGIEDWYPPTLQSVARVFWPGHPMWVQFAPFALTLPAFAVYWYRHGAPDKWPVVLTWLIPVQLLLAPYSAWPSDIVLLLVPTVAVAVWGDRTGWAFQHRRVVLIVWLMAHLAIPIMWVAHTPSIAYAWAAPVYCCCLWRVAEPLVRAGRVEMPGTAGAPVPNPDAVALKLSVSSRLTRG